MAVVHLLTHGHYERDGHTFDEVLLLIAIEDEGVDHADLFLAAIKVEADYEGQPLATTLRSFVHAFDFHDRADGAAAFDDGTANVAEVIVEGKGSGDGAILGSAEQPGGLHHLASIALHA